MDAAPRDTADCAVTVTLVVVSNVMSSASAAVTVLLVTLASAAVTGHSKPTTLFTMRSISSESEALPLAGIFTSPTLLSAVVGVLSTISVRFVPTTV